MDVRAGSQPLRSMLEGLPYLPLRTVLGFITARDLLVLSRTCRTFGYLSFGDEEWRRFCLMDWPWFFYNGECECTGLPDDQSKRLRCQAPHESYPPKSGPLHASFPSLPPTKLSYMTILRGEHSTLVHIISSKNDRQMSAYLGLATYHHPTDSLLASYDPSVIASARKGKRILIKPVAFTAPPPQHANMYISDAIPDAVVVDDRIAMIGHRHRVRRVPDELLAWDPRELYCRELFDMDLDPRTGAPIYWPGEEVEIQWRKRPDSPYGWWRGIVAGVGVLESSESRTLLLPEWDLFNVQAVMDRASQGDDWSLDPPTTVTGGSRVTTEMLQQSNMGLNISGNENGRMRVVFPHYPQSSSWHSVLISTCGLQEQNIQFDMTSGFVGGIRRVRCKTHRLLWKRNFERASWYDNDG